MDIWNIIESLVKPLSFLREHNIGHGDVRPRYYNCTPSGELLLLPIHICTGKYFNNYDLARTGTFVPYLSPLQLNNLQ